MAMNIYNFLVAEGNPVFEIGIADFCSHVRVSFHLFEHSASTYGKPYTDFVASSQDIKFISHNPATLRKMSDEFLKASEKLKTLADKLELKLKSDEEKGASFP